MDIILQACYIVFTGIVRIFPLPFNFSPIYSLSNYVFVNNKRSYISALIMIALLIFTDLILYLKDSKNYIFPGWFWLYAHPIHILNGFLAKYIIKNNEQYLRIGLTCTLTSINFWILSNFGVFLVDTE
jgi:hypothetical protein